jgi:hypothetical protein
MASRSSPMSGVILNVVPLREPLLREREAAVLFFDRFSLNHNQSLAQLNKIGYQLAYM